MAVAPDASKEICPWCRPDIEPETTNVALVKVDGLIESLNVTLTATVGTDVTEFFAGVTETTVSADCVRAIRVDCAFNG